MVVEEPTKRAEDAGIEWAEQFHVDGDANTANSLRSMVGLAYSAGWITGYREALADAKRVLEGV